MKIDLSSVFDLIKALVAPSQGTKFLIGAAGIGAIVYMQIIKVSAIWPSVIVGLIVVAFFISDFIAKRTGVTNAATDVEKMTTMAGAPNSEVS